MRSSTCRRTAGRSLKMNHNRIHGGGGNTTAFLPTFPISCVGLDTFRACPEAASQARQPSQRQAAADYIRADRRRHPRSMLAAPSSSAYRSNADALPACGRQGKAAATAAVGTHVKIARIAKRARILARVRQAARAPRVAPPRPPRRRALPPPPPRARELVTARRYGSLSMTCCSPCWASVNPSVLPGCPWTRAWAARPRRDTQCAHPRHRAPVPPAEHVDAQ